MTPEERAELLAGYALGTLSAPDSRAVEALVRAEPAAEAELLALHEIVDLIALDVPLRRADPSLRARVLSAARRGVELSRPRRWPLYRAVTAAAAAAATIAIVVWTTGMQGDLDELRRETATLSAVVQADAKLIAELTSGEGFIASEAMLLQLAADRMDVERDALVAVTLDSAAWDGVFDATTASHGATGEYRWSNKLSAGVIVAHDLPRLPLQSVYQVWLDDGIRLVSAGTFVPNTSGDATLLARADVFIQPLRISISVAPIGGALTIGSPVVLSGVFHR